MENVNQPIAEHYNPRAAILGACFLGGVTAGFFLYLFRAPEPAPEPPPQIGIVNPESPGAPDPTERRRLGAPDITSVEANPAQAASLRPPTLENLDLAAPPALLTTEGGLTGMTAGQLTVSHRPEPAAPDTGPRPAGAAGAPPPLPDLMP